MAETERLQLDFIREVLVQGFRKVYSKQAEVAQKRIYSRKSTEKKRTGLLLNALQRADFEVEKGSLGVYLAASYPLYIRFLDMKRSGNYRIYNRIIWPHIYRDAIPEIEYGYSDRVLKTIKEQIERSYN